VLVLADAEKNGSSVVHNLRLECAEGKSGNDGHPTDLFELRKVCCVGRLNALGDRVDFNGDVDVVADDCYE
jgi:hypothetical protein